MGDWKIVVPQATQNLFSDPSFALSDPDTEWTIVGDGTAPDFTRTTAIRFFGFSCALADIDDGTYASIYQSISSPPSPATLSCYVRRSGAGVPTASHVRARFDSSAQDFDSITAVGNGWYRCEISDTVSNNPANMGVVCLEDGMKVDGMQLEDGSTRTTFCDGEQEGCTWDGAPWTSSSTRSAQSRAGGVVRDLSGYYGFAVAEVLGGGAAGRDVAVRAHAVLPGGRLSQVRRGAREFTLVGPLTGDSSTTIYARRQTLLELLAHDAVPATADGWQPVRLQFHGAAVPKEIAAHYVGGLEGAWALETVLGALHERVAISFVATDPLATALGDTAQVLDTNDSVTVRYAAGRLRSTGQWDDLGLTANPSANGDIYVMVYNPHDGRLYVGGNFTGWDNNIGWDYIVAYDPATDTWARVGGASAVNGVVYALAVAPNGDVYAGGAFTNVGDADGDYVAYYDLSAGSWASVAAGGAGTVWALAFDQDGVLYIGGDYVNWGDANGDYLVSWDGSAYASLGTGMNGIVYGLAVGLDGTLYAGGTFTTAGGTTVNYVASWDGSAWAALGDGFDAYVVDVSIHPATGELYAAGNFTTNHAATETFNYVARYTGGGWQALGSGVNAIAYRAHFGPDGLLYCCGAFTEAGGEAIPDRMALWNGSSWAGLDIDLPGPGPIIRAFCACRPDPVVPALYDLYVGFDSTGTAYVAGTADAAVEGSAPQYPQIVLKRTGGTLARLYRLRNEATGQTLYSNYGLLDGETLTIDCRPGKKRVWSDMFGARPDAILANSDLGAFALPPGTNQLTAFVAVSGSPTVLAYVQWREAYDGLD